MAARKGSKVFDVAGGRPRTVGPAELVTLRHLVADFVSVTEAARTLKFGRSTAYKALAGARE
ncbi:hypothetical protein [Nonomuraea sp. NPDC049709]|uniref:hypothetical protein n=1 Tax=Nonomuraea sp. NPDC049709 TaxID=3154736 RepID=UPI003442AE59